MSTASIRLAAIGLCLAVASPSLFAAADAPLPYVPGEKWNISTNVSMPGMSMPPGMKMPAGMAMPGGMGMPSQAMEVCQAKGTSASQAAEQQKNCTITNKRMVAGKQTAHMACTMEGHKMEGDVEMESLGPDHYRTTMHMKTDSGAMDMVSEGQKIGGECDANELKRKGEAIVAQAKQGQAQADKYMAGQCHDAATQVRLDLFKIKDSPCTNPADKALLCSTARGYDRFGDLLAAQRSGAVADPSNPYAQDAGRRLSDIGSFCGFQPEAVHASLCGSAEKDNKLVFLGENCPAQADPLGKAQCAGAMQFTGGPPIDAKYVSFCRAWVNTDSGRAASDAARGAGAGKAQVPPKEQSQADKAKEAIEKGKAKLKGLFGR